MALQGYWMLPINGWADNTTADWWRATPPGGIGPNQGVRAYCVVTSDTELEDQASSVAEISSYVQNGTTHTGPFSCITTGPGVSEVTAHVQATNTSLKSFLIVDIFN